MFPYVKIFVPFAACKTPSFIVDLYRLFGTALQLAPLSIKKFNLFLLQCSFNRLVPTEDSVFTVHLWIPSSRFLTTHFLCTMVGICPRNNCLHTFYDHSTFCCGLLYRPVFYCIYTMAGIFLYNIDRQIFCVHSIYRRCHTFA